MPVKRYDVGELQKPEHLPNGWVRVDGYISRVGVQVYKNSDGTERREFRPAEEVMKQDSLDTLALAPLTIRHPPVGLLDANNTKEYQVGTVERPSVEGQRLRARMLVTDAAAVTALGNGVNQLSVGYTCDLEMSSGEYEGQRYDAVQKNIRGNHVALVPVARGGPELRVRLDSESAAAIEFQNTDGETASRDSVEGHTMKITLDGIDFDIADAAAQAATKALTGAATALNAAKVETEKLQAKLDSANAELVTLQETVKELPAKLQAQMSARTALEGQARKVLGAEAKFDGKSDAEIRKDVVAKSQPSLKLDGKSELYVEAAFDQLLMRADSTESVSSTTKEADIQGSRSDSAPVDPSDAEKKYLEAVQKVSHGGK